jgi:fatty acid synthase subunit alpha
MVWIMGFVKHFDGRLPNGALHVGWVDAKSGELVDDKDVKANILAHSSVRLIGKGYAHPIYRVCCLTINCIEPDLFKGYDSKRKGCNQEAELTHDLEPMEVSEDRRRNSSSSMVTNATPGLSLQVNGFSSSRKAPAFLYQRSSRLIVSLLANSQLDGTPGATAFPPQTDRAALWALVCTAEALIVTGITDPCELYQHVHLHTNSGHPEDILPSHWTFGPRTGHKP